MVLATHMAGHKEEAGDLVGSQDLVREHSEDGQAQIFLFLVCFFSCQHHFSPELHYILKIHLHQGPAEPHPSDSVLEAERN